MYSDNTPPATHTTGQPPSQSHMGHNQQTSQDHRGFHQTTMIVDNNTKAPSFTDMGNRQEDSYNKPMTINRQLGGGSYVSGTGGQPLSVGDMVKGGVSETSGGVDHAYYKDDKAPNLSDMGRRGASETGASEMIVVDDPDAQELVGISLVGKNFRKFYPNAYYKGDDDDDDDGN